MKYVSNFWRTLEILLINCEISFILTWSANGVITNSTGVRTFAIIDAKSYVALIMENDDGKLLQQLKSCFKVTIN